MAVVSAPKTLENARDGLLRYWGLRPNGGNRAELIQLAIAQGFEEPLLNEWLDVFLRGFVATQTLGVLLADYDQGLEPARVAAGPVVAAAAVNAVFDHLTARSNSLAIVRKANLVAQLDDLIAAVQATRNLTATGRAQVATSAMTTNVKAATLAAIDVGLAALDSQIAGYSERRDALAAEIAASLP